MKKLLYRCQSCGYLSPQWLGRCPTCGEWGSFKPEEPTVAETRAQAQAQARVELEPLPLGEISLEEANRWPTGLGELDRLLGGGVIAGSVILLGGEPGVGKSTLMLQVADRLARAHGPVLYVCGEESPAQVKLRAARLRLEAERELLVLPEQHLELIERAVRELRPKALVVDSIQTVLPAGEKVSEPGSTRAVGVATFALAQLARELELPIFLVGHITKSGEFAGPKAIEHLVDVVLYLEGTQGQGEGGDLRLLRATKNRYGSCEEVGVFRMGECGLEEVANPSQLFTQRSSPQPKPGSVIVPSLEGSRPILVEVQALVSSGGPALGYPQRRATGLDYNRVVLLLAVIEKRLGLHIGSDDVYLNVAGGLTLREPAADLGVVAAVVSSFRDQPVPYDTVIVGEVSLSGEVRPVRRLKERLAEASRLGYRQAVIPQNQLQDERGLELGMELHPAGDIEEAMATLF